MHNNYNKNIYNPLYTKTVIRNKLQNKILYILFRYKTNNVILSYENNIFSFTNHIKKNNNILILEEELKSFGTQLFLQYNMHNIIFLPQLIHKMHYTNIVFYFEYITIICEKHQIHGHIIYYSLFTGTNHKQLLSEYKYKNKDALIINNPMENVCTMNLFHGLFDISTLSDFSYEVKFFYLLRQYQNIVFFLCVILSCLNLLIFYILS
jgi:hypothetical protein